MIYGSLLRATRRLRFCALVLSLLAGAAQAAVQPTDLPSAERAPIQQPQASLGKLPLSLNLGQAAAPVSATGLAMQFHSAGHVLGFTPEGVLVAGRDHLLKVNFVGAAAVAPKAVADTPTTPPKTRRARPRPQTQTQTQTAKVLRP